MNKMILNLSRDEVEILIESLVNHKNIVSKEERQTLVNMISFVENRKAHLIKKNYFQDSKYSKWRCTFK